MEAVYDTVKIILKDKADNELDFKIVDFYELDEEIRIVTTVRNEDVQRGWIGDLIYETKRGIELNSLDEIDKPITQIFNDVLLARITLQEARFQEACMWQYVFLKK